MLVVQRAELVAQVYEAHISRGLPTSRCEARTFGHRLILIWPVTIREQVVLKPNSCLELLLQKVALVQEQHDWDFFEELV